MAFPTEPQPCGAAVQTAADIVIVGSGFAGLAMAIKLRAAGFGDFILLEKASDIGGTWRDNRYPGAASDIPSHLYSLSFEPNPLWSRVYPQQEELQAYLRMIADRHALWERICLNTGLAAAVWDPQAQRWGIKTDGGVSISARILISATGALHHPAIPRLPGIEHFAGRAFHSAAWDTAYDLAGKRVAVIGTGASAAQFVPEIAPIVGHLTVFQRTPPWVNPKFDGPISRLRQFLFRWLPLYRRLFRTRLFWLHEMRVLAFTGRTALMQRAQAVAQRHLEQQIADPALRARLTPTYLMGCKRVLISNDYYPALTRTNVELVTDRIAEIRAHTVVTVDGVERPADAIIYGTGFQTTNAFARIDIVGRGGVTLAQRWAGGMSAYLGLCVDGFPNYFMLLGPNTGLGHNSVVIMIEAQVRYVVSALRQMRRMGQQTIEVRPEVITAFAAEIDQRMARTVWQSGGCRSWYQDANGRNTTLWPGSVVGYLRRTRRAAMAEFQLGAGPAAA